MKNKFNPLWLLVLLPLFIAAYNAFDYVRINKNYYLPVPTVLVDGATVTPDRDVNESFTVTLTGNPTLAAPANGIEGSIVKIKFLAASVSNVVTMAAAYHVSPDMTLITSNQFTVATNTVTIILAEKSGSTWFVTGCLPNLAP